MKKDVIYIDTEDDITAIIDKVKHAAAPVVALVPPKRVGVLQSTVNLKLLQRAAEYADKRVVLITNDAALSTLAGGLSIPIAKNLQSKPEIAEISALDSDDGDVIDGESIPVAPIIPGDPAGGAIDDESGEEVASVAATAASVGAASAVGSQGKETVGGAKRAVSGTKIPNFDIFRKKLFLFGGLGVLLIAFLVWALIFAPSAVIAITARTNSLNIAKTLVLKPNVPLDTSQWVLPVVTKQVKKTASVDFTPTGKKDVGEKASGSVKIKTDAATILISGLTVPAGTQIQATNGLIYVTTASATFAKGDPAALNGVVVGVSASAPGSKYNGVTGSATTSAAGVSSVAFVDSPSGGTDKTVTIVSADDITKATTQLQNQDANAVRGELAKQFASDEIVINEAYIVESAAPVSAPAVNQEATAAKLTAETTYTLLGVKRADLKSVYDTYLATELKGDTSQKVYTSGDEATQFSLFQKTADGYSVKAIANAQVGPNIDSNKVANDARGKQIGEVSQPLEAIQGVSNVDVKLSPFWVSRVPGDAGHIKVTFVLKND